MINSVHILLSYTCLFQCDHCFLHCSPSSCGTFSVQRLGELLRQAAALDTVRHVCFEGGEPFLFYPVLAQGIAMARSLSFSTEIVSNGYWALDAEDAAHWLAPLKEAGLNTLSVSDDALHHGEDRPSPALAARAAAQSLGLANAALSVCVPESGRAAEERKGEPVTDGGIRFRGRAVSQLLDGQPRRPWQGFDHCPDEDFMNPGRVHVDAAGLVQLCQGISIGCVWERPLKEILQDFDVAEDPICGPLHRGGPAELVRTHELKGLPGQDEGYADACHLCYEARRALIEQYPGRLAPLQAYGC